MKNIEKIRQMDAYDLAEFLQQIADSCYECGRFGSEACEESPLQERCGGEIIDWLESEEEK